MNGSSRISFFLVSLGLILATVFAAGGTDGHQQASEPERTLSHHEASKIFGGAVANRKCARADYCDSSDVCSTWDNAPFICNIETEKVAEAMAKGQTCSEESPGEECYDGVYGMEDCAIIYDCMYDLATSKCVRSLEKSGYERAPENCHSSPMPPEEG